MRLINVWTLGLEWFDDEAGPPPPYVVLSHVHGDDDVSLADLGDLPGRAGKTAILKLENVCRVTREHRLADYAWIDTCCIDRTSTLELSTALNSLFTWFRNAVVCFAYLADVDAAASVAADDSGGGNLPLWRSRWFTRGWTLPELLAPRRVEFFDHHAHVVHSHDGHCLPRALELDTDRPHFGGPDVLHRMPPDGSGNDLPFREIEIDR